MLEVKSDAGSTGRGSGPRKSPQRGKPIALRKQASSEQPCVDMTAARRSRHGEGCGESLPNPTWPSTWTGSIRRLDVVEWEAGPFPRTFASSRDLLRASFVDIAGFGDRIDARIRSIASMSKIV